MVDTTPTANRPGHMDATVRTSITSCAHVDKIYDKPISNSSSPCNPKFARDEYISRISSWLQHRAKVLAEMSVSPVGTEVRAMTRFYFHWASRENTICDEKGRDFSDLAAAHRHAMLLIHKMVALDDVDVDWRGWCINVTDATQRSKLTVLFPQSYCRQAGSAATQPDRDTAGR